VLACYEAMCATETPRSQAVQAKSYDDPETLFADHVWRGHVVEVIDWSRAELFEAVGLPMSFPLSDRSNEDEVNAKEVR
jgi:hypothetical protein